MSRLVINMQISHFWAESPKKCRPTERPRPEHGSELGTAFPASALTSTRNP